MSAGAPDFRPIRAVDGYLRLEDHGLIGDGATAALVGLDGGVSWMCVPRFDDPPLFCGLLDAARGGAFRIAMDDATEARQYYEDETGVLVTEMRGPSGGVRITDALALRPGANLAELAASDRAALVRVVEGLHGKVLLRIVIQPRGEVTVDRSDGRLRLRCSARSELPLQVRSSVPLEGIRSTCTLGAGERAEFLLSWGDSRHEDDLAGVLEDTRAGWRRWVKELVYDGPQAALVRRAAITLKLLDYLPNGGMVASPTSSLPEVIGGVRNWDYRYTWIRDASFSVYAFRRVGMWDESQAFLGWVLDAAGRHDRPRVLYNLEGHVPLPERTDPDLEGYRGSRPVRWGNAAAEQRQHDVFGEILDCAYQWAAHHGSIDASLWARLTDFVERARREWHDPDHGIWEVRTAGRPFTYSAALCQVALDRAAKLVQRFGLEGDAAMWRAEADRVRDLILEEAWDPEKEALVQHLGGGGIDASLLALPLRRVVPADHPRMVATTRAIVEHLSVGRGLLYRYLVPESPDGLPGHESAFLVCSFWLVENLTLQGRIDKAMDLYDALCARASPLGLLPEQIDPGSGEFRGNFPQALSHVGLISSGARLGKLLKKRSGPG